MDDDLSKDRNKDVRMNQFQFQTVPNIIAGLGSIQELRTILSQHDYQRFWSLMLAWFSTRLHLPILDILDQIGLETIIYSDIQADPPEHIVLEAVDFATQEQIDVIIGFGGGSSMDVAKIIALLAHPKQRQKLSEIYGCKPSQIPSFATHSYSNNSGNRFRSHTNLNCHNRCNTKMGVVAPILYADVHPF